MIICFLQRWSGIIRIQNDIQSYSRISYLRMLLFIIHIDLQQMNSFRFILESHVVFTSIIYFISINKSIQLINQNDISILIIINSLQKQSFSFHNLFLSYRYSYHHNLLLISFEIVSFPFLQFVSYSKQYNDSICDKNDYIYNSFSFKMKYSYFSIEIILFYSYGLFVFHDSSINRMIECLYRME